MHDAVVLLGLTWSDEEHRTEQDNSESGAHKEAHQLAEGKGTENTKQQ